MKPRNLSLLGTVLLLVGSGDPAHPEERREYASVTIEEMSRSRFSPGDRIEVVGRYVELHDREAVLFQSPARFVVEDPKLVGEILSLSSVHDNLTVRAVCVSTDGKLVFRVENVAAGENSDQVFEREIERYRSMNSDGVDLLFSLAKRIFLTEQDFDNPKLRRAARRACTTALKIRGTQLGPNDVNGRIEDIRKLYEVLPDRIFVMKLLVRLEKNFPAARQVPELLLEIGCRRFRGEWMPYDDFKNLQGYAQFKGRWVKKVEKELLSTIEAYNRRRDELILRRMTKREYKLLSGRGEVAVGMTRKEVYNALGFPDRVFRRVHNGKEFDQWVYEDQYYYFLDGELLDYPGASELRPK